MWCIYQLDRKDSHLIMSTLDGTWKHNHFTSQVREEQFIKDLSTCNELRKNTDGRGCVARATKTTNFPRETYLYMNCLCDGRSAFLQFIFTLSSVPKWSRWQLGAATHLCQKSFAFTWSCSNDARIFSKLTQLFAAIFATTFTQQYIYKVSTSQVHTKSRQVQPH